MDAITPNLGLIKPEVGASDDTWGEKTNLNWDTLDSAISNPTNIPLPATHTPIVESGSGDVGTSLLYAREDHVHPLGPGGAPGGASVTISDTPPASPTAGNLWWESDTGNLYIYYNDGNSSQWVLAVPAVSASALNAVTYTPQTLTAPQQAQARSNLAINQAVALAAAQDLNLVITAGTYYTIDTNSTNAPLAAANWFLMVEQGPNPTLVKQTATSRGGIVYVRVLNGTWTTWQILIDSNPATGAFITSEVAPYSTVPTQRAQARKNIYAAPFDAMAYSGLQVNGGFDVNQEKGTTTSVSGGAQSFLSDV
ncbi:MAG TPA: pyocin knob domain-containing protein, partial [Methylobacter sp.]